MVGFPIDYGDNLTPEQASKNLKEAAKNLKDHSKEVAKTLFGLLLSYAVSGPAYAKDVKLPAPANQEAAKTAINSALGKNPNVIGFVAGMICVGLVSGLSGPVGMFAAGAFCAGSFGYLLGIGR